MTSSKYPVPFVESTGKDPFGHPSQDPLRRWSKSLHGQERFVASSQIPSTVLEALVARNLQLLNAVVQQMESLSYQLSTAVQAIADIQGTLAERPIVAMTALYSLSSETLELIRPLPVAIEQYENEVIARWPEAGASGQGSSEMEAIAELRRDIADLFEELNAAEERPLGGHTLLVRELLASIIRKRHGQAELQTS